MCARERRSGLSGPAWSCGEFYLRTQCPFRQGNQDRAPKKHSPGGTQLQGSGIRGSLGAPREREKKAAGPQRKQRRKGKLYTFGWFRLCRICAPAATCFTRRTRHVFLAALIDTRPPGPQLIKGDSLVLWSHTRRARPNQGSPRLTTYAPRTRAHFTPQHLLLQGTAARE